MKKKFSLTKTTKEHFGTNLFQIKAEVSFGSVSKGELGGYVEKEENLSQEDNAWVYGNASVYGNARVSGNARVYGDASVYGDARVSGDAWVSGKIKLLAGYFFGRRYKKEEIKYVQVDDDVELIYKGDGKFGDSEDDEITNAIKLLEKKGKLKDGKILI